jgi:hypothetical protein
MTTNVYFWSYLAQFFVEYKMFKKNSEEIITNFIFNNRFFEFRAFYEKMWKHIVERDRRMCIACWITKAADIPSEYVTFIAFSEQQWLHERASMLRFNQTYCLLRVYVNPIHQKEWNWKSFLSHYLCFPSKYHSTNAPYSFAPQCSPYQKDKRARALGRNVFSLRLQSLSCCSPLLPHKFIPVIINVPKRWEGSELTTNSL